MDQVRAGRSWGAGGGGGRSWDGTGERSAMPTGKGGGLFLKGNVKVVNMGVA